MSKKYKVFISFKNSAEQNKRVTTPETAIAERLFERLEREGIETFFSPKCIENPSTYQEEINGAIYQSDIFVLISTRAEHIDSKQVKKEILTYDHLCRDDKKDENKTQAFLYVTPSCNLNDVSEGLFPTVDMMTKVQSESELLERIVKRVTKVGQVKNDGDRERNILEESSQSLAAGELIDGKYEIIKKIGQGGMSEVYLAMDKRLNRVWAIKCIRAVNQNNKFLLESMREEVQLLKALQHPNIVRIVDVIKENNRMFVVMDYVEGTHLQSILEKTGKMQLESTLRIARQLCSVLMYLHSREPRIIYRDLKPSNLIMQPDGNVMLLDFGTAREYKPGNLEDTVSLGTRGYAAPEQYGGAGQSDERTDIYNLGMTLYHIVTGISPAEYYYGIDYAKVENLILRNIIIKCTQQHPDKRFQKVQEVSEQLEKVTSKSIAVKADMFLLKIKQYLEINKKEDVSRIEITKNKARGFLMENEDSMEKVDSVGGTDLLAEMDSFGETDLLSETSLLGEASQIEEQSLQVKEEPTPMRGIQPQPLAVCVCSTAGVIDEREQDVYVYVLNQRAMEEVKRFVFNNNEIKCVWVGKAFCEDLFRIFYDVSITSDTMQFKKVEVGKGVGYRRWHYRRSEILDIVNTHSVQVNILCEDVEKLEDVPGFAKLKCIDTLNLEFPGKARR